MGKPMSKLRELVYRVFTRIKRAAQSMGAITVKGAPTDSAEWEFIRGVAREHHFTSSAQRWLEENIKLRVDDLSTERGGGYWAPDRREVRLFSAQHEAAVHELSHAWWQDRRDALKDEMIEAVVRLSAEADQRYSDLARLAHGYVHGIPEQPWEGLLVTRNDWEMFAGIASGTMGDMTKLPPYVRRLYSGLFEMPA
jgi:hypothetical protein